MLALAAPLALAELGWMAMGVVDTVMAGPLGSAAIGAGSLGSMLFYPIVIFGTGMLLGMDALVAQSFGAGDRPDCRRTLVNGLWLAAGLAPPLALALWTLIPLLALTGTNPRVSALFAAYLKALLWGILPLLFYTAFRRYLQAVDIVKPIAFALVGANVVNIAGNYALMYGHWGFPAMGLTGSGYSTSIARVYMAAVLLAAVAWHERTRPLSNGAASGPGSDSRSEPRTSESGPGGQGAGERIWTICPVRLPGREVRSAEAAFDRMAPLVEALAAAIEPYLDRPFAFFGHSMGAAVAFELARRLRRLGLSQPCLLIASAARAPQFRRDYIPPPTPSEAQFLGELRRLEGFPAEALDDPALVGAILPALTADAALYRNYVYAEDTPLGFPVRAYGGSDDPNVRPEHLEGWAGQTSASFAMRLFPGGHFFLHAGREAVLDALAEDLEQAC